jgi:hypothetical protein
MEGDDSLHREEPVEAGMIADTRNPEPDAGVLRAEPG